VLKLIRLDLTFNRNSLLLVMAVMTGFFVYFTYRGDEISPRAFFLLAAFYVGASLSVTLAAREEKFKYGALTCSLPVRRSTIVAARFVLTWALMILALAYVVALAAALPFSRVDIGAALSVKFILTGFLILSLVFSLMLPFTLRFGVMGVMMFLVTAQVAGIVGLLLAGHLSGGRVSIGSPLSAAIRGLKFLVGPESTATHMLLVAAAVVVLNIAAFIASKALYARRDQ
jgi:hypothetical protein